MLTYQATTTAPGVRGESESECKDSVRCIIEPFTEHNCNLEKSEPQAKLL